MAEKAEGSVNVDKGIDPGSEPGGLARGGEDVVHFELLDGRQRSVQGRHALQCGVAFGSSPAAGPYIGGGAGIELQARLQGVDAGEITGGALLEIENSLAYRVASPGPRSGPNVWLNQGAGMA